MYLHESTQIASQTFKLQQLTRPFFGIYSQEKSSLGSYPPFTVNLLNISI